MELIFSDESTFLYFVLAVALIGVVLLLLYFNFSSLFFNDDELIDSHKIAFPLSSYETKRSGSEVFFEYKHANINEWIDWIHCQDNQIQEIAFARLTEYLQKPVNELGVITTEVIRAVACFDHPNSFSLLIAFINQIRNATATMGSALLFYDAAFRAFIELEQERAQVVIVQELENLKIASNSDALKDILVRCATQLRMNDELAELFASMLLVRNREMDIHQIIIEQLDLRSVAERKHFLLTALRTFAKEFQTNQIGIEQSRSLRSMFERLYSFVLEGDHDVWNALLETLSVRHLQADVAQLMVNLVADISINLEPWQLYGLLNLPQELRRRFVEAIGSRFLLSDFEKVLVYEPVLADDYAFNPQSIVVEKMKMPMLTPDFLSRYVPAFETILLRKRNPRTNNDSPINGVSIISGAGQVEKLYLTRATAAAAAKAFVYIDAHEIIVNSEKLFDLQTNILKARPCLVYIDNIDEALKGYPQIKENQVAKDLLDIFKKLCLNPNISIIIALRETELEARRKYGSKFSIVYDVPETETALREAVVNAYFSRLLERRIPADIDVAALIAAFSELNVIDFCSKIHKYIKVSLLCFGKIIPHEEYLKLIAEIDLDHLGESEAAEGDHLVAEPLLIEPSVAQLSDFQDRS